MKTTVKLSTKRCDAKHKIAKTLIQLTHYRASTRY